LGFSPNTLLAQSTPELRAQRYDLYIFHKERGLFIKILVMKALRGY